eukprot:CAMPEP_0117433454 /NCGR_PEP_ID=MMETSP0758-20121206/12824_1 /TAXON_ID=63605 /ORGANISM="Percolomonas cosmopolitus, Strain AE-1 (ATCC 50343)" /LENGTH=104 /DNA_ID=CAMNT_0005224151 /DNA_START=104 /DNA_END=415 /DNA_ORIENTATION=-
MKESWYEKLGQWDEAMEVYQRKMLAHPENLDYLLGSVRCHAALHEWDDVYTILSKRWDVMKEDEQEQVAHIVCSALREVCSISSNFENSDVVMEDDRFPFLRLG